MKTKMALRSEVIKVEEMNGEDLDAILDILDSDFLEELVDIFEEACEQVIIHFILEYRQILCFFSP